MMTMGWPSTGFIWIWSGVLDHRSLQLSVFTTLCLSNITYVTNNIFPVIYHQCFINFHSRKCIWKHHLRNGGHFVSASMLRQCAFKAFITCDPSVPSPHMTNGYCHMLNSWLEIYCCPVIKGRLAWVLMFSFLACYHVCHISWLQLNPKFILSIYRTNMHSTVHCKILKYTWLIYFHDFCIFDLCIMMTH